MKVKVQVKRNSADAVIPRKINTLATGFDLFSPIDVEIAPNNQTCLPLGISLYFPLGYCGRITERSGMAMKRITVNGGTIDQDYQGEIKVLLENRSETPYTVLRGDRIAQMVVEKLVDACFTEIDNNVATHSSERAGNGFGSSGR